MRRTHTGVADEYQVPVPQWYTTYEIRFRPACSPPVGIRVRILSSSVCTVQGGGGEHLVRPGNSLLALEPEEQDRAFAAQQGCHPVRILREEEDQSAHQTVTKWPYGSLDTPGNHPSRSQLSSVHLLSIHIAIIHPAIPLPAILTRYKSV